MGSSYSFASDSEAGPDIADFDGEEFRPATAEAFKDPNAFDFLSQHGQANNAAANLARYIQNVQSCILQQCTPYIHNEFTEKHVWCNKYSFQEAHCSKNANYSLYSATRWLSPPFCCMKIDLSCGLHDHTSRFKYRTERFLSRPTG